MQLQIAALYAGILAIFALILSVKAGLFRSKTGISVLFGEPVNLELAQRVRAHQNFLEYVPMIVILMGIIEINGGSLIFLHVVGVALILSRIFHAAGLRYDNMAHPGRAIGAGGTMLITLVAAGYAIWMSVASMPG
jgi:uncharacterized membrane protein YecN with MAPEG domain